MDIHYSFLGTDDESVTLSLFYQQDNGLTQSKTIFIDIPKEFDDYFLCELIPDQALSVFYQVIEQKMIINLPGYEWLDSHRDQLGPGATQDVLDHLRGTSGFQETFLRACSSCRETVMKLWMTATPAFAA